MHTEAIIVKKSQTKIEKKCRTTTEVLEELENNKQRMYCFVERHLSPIDKGIQAAHSIVEYSKLYSEEVEYDLWAYYDKTIIILNGGTVADLNDICRELNEHNINYALFKEEDLGNIITSIAILVDEATVNYEESGEEANVGNKNTLFLRDLIKSKHLAR